MENWEIIETLQLAVDEENWELVNKVIDHLDDIEPRKEVVAGDLQDEDYY
jgi:hypothetical protein|tara:strand:+ start:2231 stop:2380 length:150 start_codon:yes stop_codon:yes gene_type:complete